MTDFLGQVSRGICSRLVGGLGARCLCACSQEHASSSWSDDAHPGSLEYYLKPQLRAEVYLLRSLDWQHCMPLGAALDKLVPVGKRGSRLSQTPFGRGNSQSRGRHNHDT